MLPYARSTSSNFSGVQAPGRKASSLVRIPLALAALLGLCLAPSSGWTAGGVQVAPTRVVLEGHERTAELSVINGGASRANYRVSFKHVRMTEDGRFEEIAAPGPADRPAEGMIRYAPRQVVLDPGQSQTVRLLLRKPADLPPGEYRSHLVFTAVPSPSQDDLSAVLGARTSEVVVQLRPIFSVSVPVIVRHGDLSASVRLSELGLERGGADGDSPATLKLRLERAGEKSVYGDLEATFVPRSGSPEVVALVRGIAVYPTTPARTVELPLREWPSGGELRVTYREQPEQGGATLAEAVLPL